MTQADRSLEGLSGPVVLVGAGRMGGALLQGWLERGLAASALRIFEPQPSPEIRALNDRGTRINPPVAEVRDAAAVVIAVKPQVAGEIVPGLAPMLGPTSVAISIMAGKTLGFLQGHLPDSSLVRAMPNTPASIGRGITVAVGLLSPRRARPRTPMCFRDRRCPHPSRDHPPPMLLRQCPTSPPRSNPNRAAGPLRNQRYTRRHSLLCQQLCK